MANLFRLTEYKSKIMQKICTDPELVSLLNVDGETLSGHDLMYERVFPYAYVPDVTEIGRSFICFDIDVPKVDTDIIKTVQLVVYVFAAQSIMRLPEGKGIRIDMMAAHVDKLLNGSEDFGVGQLGLQSVYRFTPITGYHGRELRYRVKDINRYICGG